MTKLRYLALSFVGISILSFIMGAGLFQTVLITIGFILFLLILVASLVISINDKKNWWWDVFKPNLANPTAWGLLHLILALVQPEIFKEIWLFHRLWLITAEICIFAINSIVNKNVVFEKRFSRWAMSVIYIILLVFSIGAIYARLFRGDIITDINRTELTAFKNSKIEALVFEIEKSSKEHQFNVIEARLKQLLEKSKKVSLSEAEFKEMEDLEGKNKKTYALPNKKSPPAPEMRKPRLLRGIYELPANGTAICQTIRKEKLIFSAGEPVRFEQLENPTVFQVMNDNIPFLKISQRTYTTGPALTGGPICLRASGGKKALVRTVILD